MPPLSGLRPAEKLAEISKRNFSVTGVFECFPNKLEPGEYLGGQEANQVSVQEAVFDLPPGQTYWQ